MKGLFRRKNKEYRTSEPVDKEKRGPKKGGRIAEVALELKGKKGVTMHKTMIVAVCVLVLLCAGSTGTYSTASMEEIKIGIVAPLTGGASTTGRDMWQAAVLAADEINAQGGVYVNGVYVKVKLFQGDTETSREGGLKAVTKLITEDKVDLLIGGFSSGITFADQIVASEHKVPFIITGASTPMITKRADIDTSYFFHHCPTTDDYPEATLLFVDEIVRPKIYERFKFPEGRPIRLGVLYQDSNFGEGVYDGIKKAIEKHNLGMEIVSAEKFKMSETDFRTALTVIKESKPDVVYPAGFLNEQTLIVAQGRRDVGLNTIYLSEEYNDDPDYYTGVERWGEYSIQESRFSPYAIPSGPIHDVVAKFREDFESKWAAPPSMMGASTYEGVYIAAEAIKNAGTLDKEKIRASLAALEMPQIIEVMQNGVITFSPDYRESKFELYMEQLIWDENAGETRPKIVWPDSIKETDFVLPDWYEPGKSSTPILPPVVMPTPRPPVEVPTEAPRETPTPTPSPFASIPPLYILGAVAIIVIVLIAGIGISHKGKRGKSAKLQPPAEPPKPESEPAKQEPIIKKETPPPIFKSITIERAIYDPCKRDFIEGQLPRMKEWINRYDPGAYWFAMSIQNDTDKIIEEWDVELEFSSALKIKDAKIEGIEIEIPHEAHLGLFKISVPKEYGIVIPKGGAQRVYFKLRAEKPKTTYKISGIFKSEISGDVPIRAKEFKYLCDAGVSPEAVKAELKKTFSGKDAARLALSFKTVQELDRMCNQDTKTEEYLDKLSVLKNYTEGFSDMFTNQLDDFSRFMKQEQLGYLDDEYKGKVRMFCTNLVDVWISEFLKG